MPQAAQISPHPSPGATPRPRPQLVPQNVPANNDDMGEGPTPPPNPATENASTPQSKKISEPRVNATNAFLMICAGVLLDLTALIPFVGGYAAEIIGALTFSLWFLILNLPLMSPKTVANWGLNLIVGESVTAGAWPGFTIGTILTVIMSRAEDKTGLDVMSLAKGDVKSFAEVGKNLSGQLQGQAAGGAPQTGATTPAASVKSQTGSAAAKDVHPVIASQQEHFADPSQPISAAPGATPRPTNRPTRIPRRQEASSQDEEVATGLRGAQDIDSFSPDAYQEDPYSLESPADQQGPANEAFGPRRVTPEMRPAPFPGTSPQFGRGSRYEKREAEAGEEGKLLDFDIRRKSPAPETIEDTTPKGATPPPKDVNDDVS